MNPAMPIKPPPPIKPHSFSIPEPLLEDVKEQARKEAKGARPNISILARRALKNELERAKGGVRAFGPDGRTYRLRPRSQGGYDLVP